MLISIVASQSENINKDYPWDHPFVLSKGHAALGLYAVLEFFGYIKNEELNNFAKYGSFLGGHIDSTKSSLFYFSTGSLGHGLPVAIGVAYVKKLSGDEASPIFVICGDGEFMEGSIWESLQFARRMNLTNLRILVDCNNSHTSQGQTVNYLENVIRNIGFDVSILNGHDVGMLIDKISIISPSKPQVFLCETKLGNGVKFVESKKEWHRRKISNLELQQVRNQLGIE
jgi:transketolase